jgi:hypothetical protein
MIIPLDNERTATLKQTYPVATKTSERLVTTSLLIVANYGLQTTRRSAADK